MVRNTLKLFSCQKHGVVGEYPLTREPRLERGQQQTQPSCFILYDNVTLEVQRSEQPMGDNVTNNQGIDPAKAGGDETVITHLLVPNDVVRTQHIKCAYCALPSAGAVQVEDPKKPGKQNFIRACEKHKARAIQDATRQLRRYHKKRVVIDVKGLDDGPK